MRMNMRNRDCRINMTPAFLPVAEFDSRRGFCQSGLSGSAISPDRFISVQLYLKVPSSDCFDPWRSSWQLGGLYIKTSAWLRSDRPLVFKFPISLFIKPVLIAAVLVFVSFLSWAEIAETTGASPSAQNDVVAIALPAVNEPVDLPTIRKICAQFGLHALWTKIERDPPSLPFKRDG